MKRTAFDHPKFARLGKLLNLRLYSARGVVESMWQFTAKHAPAGDIGKWSDGEIAAAIDWDKDVDELINALVESRLLDRIEGARLVVHDWDEHCEDSIHLVLARRVELFANGKRPSLARINKSERPEIEAAYTVKENELRRVESTRNTHGRRRKARAMPEPKPSLAMPEPLMCSEPAAPPTEPPVLEFPCSGNGPATYELTQTKLDEYAASYPGIDVLAECRKARQWCIDNKTDRKTHGGIPRFLNSWLGRAQDRGGHNRPPANGTKPHPLDRI